MESRGKRRASVLREAAIRRRNALKTEMEARDFVSRPKGGFAKAKGLAAKTK